jgi:hypothetical protein
MTGRKKAVIPEAVIGNPVVDVRLTSGSPIRAFGDDREKE